MKALTFGSFDLLHVGHLNLLQNISDRYPGILYVGISSDKLHEQKKGRLPIIPYSQRRRMVNYLDFGKIITFCEQETTEAYRRSVIEQIKPDVLVMGSDHYGAFDSLRDVVDVDYMGRTDGISTSQIIKRVLEMETWKI